MQRFFSIIIIFAILVVGGGYLWMQKSEQEDKARIEEELASARRTFADKARAAVTEEETDDYVRSVQAAVASYQDELKRSVYDERPEWFDPDEFKQKVETQFEEGQLKESQRKSMLEGYQIVREAYDTLMAGNWEPILTQAGKGETRLDVYEMRRIRDDQGNPILEGRFFFWGIEENTRVSWGQLALEYWVKREKEVGRGRRKKVEEVEEVLGKAEGDATPRIIIQRPSKYIDEFPSYVSVGYIWLPVMPREAHAMDIEYGYTARKGGGSYDTVLSWSKYDIPSRWQLEEGEVWEADVVEATEEEIAGTEPDAGVEEE